MYFAIYENNKLKSLGRSNSNPPKGFGEYEISEEEYNRLYAEIQEKAKWYDIIYADESRIDEVPEEWQTEILNEVHKRKSAEQAAKENASDAEIANEIEAIL